MGSKRQAGLDGRRARREFRVEFKAEAVRLAGRCRENWSLNLSLIMSSESCKGGHSQLKN